MAITLFFLALGVCVGAAYMLYDSHQEYKRMEVFLKELKTMPTESELKTIFELEDGVKYTVVVNGREQKNKVWKSHGLLFRWDNADKQYKTGGKTVPADARFKVYNKIHSDIGQEFEAINFKEGFIYEINGENVIRFGNKLLYHPSQAPAICDIPLDETFECVGQV